MSVAHGSGNHTVNLTGIGLGTFTGGATAITVTALSTNPGLIPNPSVSYTSLNTTGSITFADTGGTGTATIDVTVTTNYGGFIGGCVVITKTQSFVVTVT